MECYDQSLLFILAGLGSDPFSSGKPCSANSDCNTALGVTCCGVGTTYGKCCPDSLCITNCNASDSTTFLPNCPDHLDHLSNVQYSEQIGCIWADIDDMTFQSFDEALNRCKY